MQNKACQSYQQDKQCTPKSFGRYEVQPKFVTIVDLSPTLHKREIFHPLNMVFLM